MALSSLDIGIIIIVLLITMSIGIYASRTSGKDASQYFLSGRNMPWWLLGISMVATTFSTDTPNLVTDLVRQKGVSGNWAWWVFLLTGMLTVFVYARLWRKSGLETDLGFYELRYSGKGASLLRAFRALYLGVIFNVLAMSGVMLAAIKVGGVMLDWSPIQTIGIATTITVIFSVLGGLRGVVLTDFILFIIAMIGSVGAAIVIVQMPEIGSLNNLITHKNVASKIDFFPDFSNTKELMMVLIIPLSVQWWASWYPGSEPGGGGYVAQRMLAAKDENHALGATLFFNIAHYALRPWPWILIALASLIVFPDLDSIQAAFPNISSDIIGHDLAYPAMLSMLPHGLLGLVLASLIAAYMSTISTHLNWGASYIVFDVYKKYWGGDHSEKRLVLVGRLTTVVLVILSLFFALSLKNAKQIFDIIIMFGAGTGSIFILRWFWWRINIWSEISAMIFSGVFTLLIQYDDFLRNLIAPEYHFVFVVVATTLVWLSVTYLTQPEDDDTLRKYYNAVKPSGKYWNKFKTTTSSAISTEENQNSLGTNVLSASLGTLGTFTFLFMIGSILYAAYFNASIYALISAVCIYFLLKFNVKKSRNR